MVQMELFHEYGYDFRTFMLIDFLNDNRGYIQILYKKAIIFKFQIFMAWRKKRPVLR